MGSKNEGRAGEMEKKVKGKVGRAPKSSDEDVLNAESFQAPVADDPGDRRIR